jgi:hypothetical protein
VSLVVFSALVFWACVFGIYFASQGLTPSEFFLGRYEPLPNDLGDWKETSSASDLIREERFVVPESGASKGRLLHQVRYRDARTHAIVRIEAEAPVRRRRLGRGSRR